ncbi:DUF2314 domain-containing protein [Solwaraspora sp. WMMD406]|uniref:DUF2314 domain-containing protein n=1 Tax=Solwaraspora sp. WMMD406 TaxID=3016095 RepID=UPI0024164CD8|nr:DUF2314 domain-containing protein [Solwaraspora sp. WMMD406]MDG4765126.1 DUF2314 domain-containing protein [Solwaraspora sp. WMMD406]
MATSEDLLLPVPVPESLTATYLVPIVPPHAMVPDALDALDRLGTRLAAPVRDLAGQMLGSPLMTVETRPVEQLPDLPPDLLAAFGATGGQLERLRTATHVAVVQASYRPGWPPAHEWAGRAVAAGLAEALGGDVVDLFGLQFLDPAGALRSLPDDTGRIRLVDWILVPYSPGEQGLWFTTKGLRRFGLLELQAQEVPARFVRAWGAIMTGVARRLLRIWTEALTEPDLPAFVQLPVRLPVSGHDIAVAYGNQDRHDSAGSAVLQIALDPSTDPEADSFLTLSPPDSASTPPSGYFARICGELFGAGQPEIHYARPSDAMARAIATARRSLGEVRARFLADALPADGQLLIKYGLPAPDGHEYVWASVTGWTSPGRIAAASTVNAACDPGVRIGSPVSVDAADVVDWAVLSGDRMVEGGWTEAVLSPQDQRSDARGELA